MQVLKPGRWIGVDFNGTLWRDGEALMPMVELVRTWLVRDYDVRIFTGRVAPLNRVVGAYEDLTQLTDQAQARELVFIRLFCLTHFEETLAMTNVKDANMEELYDDRCVQVEHGTGRLIGASTRGLT